MLANYCATRAALKLHLQFKCSGFEVGGKLVSPAIRRLWVQIPRSILGCKLIIGGRVVRTKIAKKCL